MPEKTTRSGVGEAWLAQRGPLCGGERTVATAKVGGGDKLRLSLLNQWC